MSALSLLCAKPAVVLSYSILCCLTRSKFQQHMVVGHLRLRPQVASCPFLPAFAPHPLLLFVLHCKLGRLRQPRGLSTIAADICLGAAARTSSGNSWGYEPPIAPPRLCLYRLRIDSATRFTARPSTSTLFTVLSDSLIGCINGLARLASA
jgi:hypothetical protein